MKKALSILAIISVVAGLAITALPALTSADDINRYGTREYWKWWNSTRIAGSDPAPTATPVTLYSNTDGNVTDWNERYAYNGATLFTNYSNLRIRLKVSKNGSPCYGRWSYNGPAATSWTDYTFEYLLYNRSATADVEIFVRWDGSSNGSNSCYRIFHPLSNAAFSVYNSGAGNVAPDSSTAVAISNGDIIKIQISGYNPSHLVIYQNGADVWNGTISVNERSAGTIGFGCVHTGALYSDTYQYYDDLLVKEYSP